METQLVLMLLFNCANVMASSKDLPPRRDLLAAMSEDQLLEYVTMQPGMEFLKENLTKIHPDILEDSVLLTVSIMHLGRIQIKICFIQVQHELIRKYGYEAEVHSVTTSDGHILEVHRIPGGSRSHPREGKTVVYLQHGLLDSSAGWLLMGPHHGLGEL